jgi:thiol-disulfide isomerase/thioredoxin
VPARRALLQAAAGSLVLAAAPAPAHTRGEVPVGGELPDVALDPLNGPERRLSHFRGRPLFINLWASWCGPCVAEMGSIERLAWRDDRPAFAMVGISTDDLRSQALAQLARARASLSHFIDHDQVLENLLGADHIPLTVLVDARGRVLARIGGAREWDSAESLALLRRWFSPRTASA